jgi:hypothetical protein
MSSPNATPNTKGSPLRCPWWDQTDSFSLEPTPIGDRQGGLIGQAIDADGTKTPENYISLGSNQDGTVSVAVSVLDIYPLIKSCPSMKKALEYPDRIVGHSGFELNRGAKDSFFAPCDLYPIHGKPNPLYGKSLEETLNCPLLTADHMHTKTITLSFDLEPETGRVLNRRVGLSAIQAFYSKNSDAKKESLEEIFDEYELDENEDPVRIPDSGAKLVEAANKGLKTYLENRYDKGSNRASNIKPEVLNIVPLTSSVAQCEMLDFFRERNIDGMSHNKRLGRVFSSHNNVDVTELSWTSPFRSCIAFFNCANLAAYLHGDPSILSRSDILTFQRLFKRSRAEKTQRSQPRRA